MIFEICIYSIVAFLIGFYLFYFIPPLFGDAPFYPSSRKAIRDMISIADLKGDERVLDLGSGDGRLVFSAAKYCKTATGIEYNPFLVVVSRLRSLFSRNSRGTRINFIYGSYYKHDFSSYNIVFCYLLPKDVTKLEAKLAKELKPGSKIITNTFHLNASAKNPHLKQVKTLNKVKLFVV